jgi:organic hydroperoxide reductase OsmC/OhrA
MSEHRAHVEWQRETQGFAYETYNRSHYWSFDDIHVKATAASTNVPRAAGGTPGVDPEQAFVASLSSCHMLWFLHLACKAGYVVDRYADDAVGVMRKNAEGRVAITNVTLKPSVAFAGRQPTPAEHEKLHHEAHAQCFIANSVKSEVVCQPRIS